MAGGTAKGAARGRRTAAAVEYALIASLLCTGVLGGLLALGGENREPARQEGAAAPAGR